MLDNLDVGINLKYFGTALGDRSAGGVAFDIGGLTFFSIPGIQDKKISNNLGVGLVIQNMGSSQEYLEEKSS